MPDLNICFPSDPMSPREVDPEYAEDAKAFASLGAGILVWPMDEPGARVKPAKGFAVHHSLVKGAATNTLHWWSGELTASYLAMQVALGFNTEREAGVAFFVVF